MLQFYGRHTAQTDIVVSAPESYVYYMQDGSPVNLCYTDSDGIGTIDWSDLPKGEITLYSSVAKDPDNLSNDYSKTVKINENTTEIYLMPDNVLYWYGYESSNLESTTSANGWSYTGRTVGEPTYSTYYIEVGTTASTSYKGVGNKDVITPTKVFAIAKGIQTDSTKYSSLACTDNKQIAGASIESDITSTNLVKIQADTTKSYVSFGGTTNRRSELYALWYRIGGNQ